MFKKLWLKIIMWFMTTKVYKYLMYHIIPFMRLSMYYAKPSNSNYEQWGSLAGKGFKVLEPGDIILARDDKKLTSIVIGKATADSDPNMYPFIPGHAALCVSKDGIFEVAEMTHHNFTKSTWNDVCNQATRVVILRCNDWDKDYINNKVIPECLTFTNKLYDVKFVQGIQELICSELVYFADVERRLQVNLDPILGFDPYISPVGLLKAKNCKVVWDSDLEP